MIKKTTMNTILKYSMIAAGVFVGKIAANLIYPYENNKPKVINTQKFDDALKVQNDSTTALFQAQQNMKKMAEETEKANFIH